MRFGQEVQALPRSDRVGPSEGLAAAAFYVGLAATVGGAMVFARGVVERAGRGSKLGYALLAVGLVLILISVVAYVTGPRRMLPF